MATGEFTQDQNPMSNAVKDTNTNSTGTEVEQENGYPTDVENVFADDVIKQGTEEFPVFDVDKADFFNNMAGDRKKLRFKSGSKAMEYKNRTKNSLRPFYIRTQDDNGRTYTRKIR